MLAIIYIFTTSGSSSSSNIFPSDGDAGYSRNYRIFATPESSPAPGT
jgi:hypothetical protein